MSSALLSSWLPTAACCPVAIWLVQELLAARAGLISWEAPRPPAHLLLSDPILSLTPLDLLAQQPHGATLVPRSSLEDVDTLAFQPGHLPRASGSRHLPWSRGRVNYRRWGIVIKAFDQDDGEESLGLLSV